MKKIIFLFFLTALIYSGCKNDDTAVTPNPPAGEVEMASVGYDSLASLFGGSGSVSQTKNFSSGALNFTDRDSTRISFSYKGSSNANDTLFYVNDASNARVYTLKDASATDVYKTINITVPSVKVNAVFYYTMKARTSGGISPYLVIKDLKIYKK